MRISDWSSDVCSSDLPAGAGARDALRVQPHDVGAIADEDLGQPGEEAGAVLAGDLDAVGDPRGIAVHGIEAERRDRDLGPRSEEHTSELQSLMRHSYAVFCLK